jgi:hypothetical protein
MRDCPCAMSPNENEQPRRGLRTVAAGSALLKRLPLMSHRPHPSASRPRSSAVPIQRRRPDHRHHPATPATRPSNSSPGWRQPKSPLARRLVTPQTTPALTDPGAWRARRMARPPEPLIPAAGGAGPGHHADPSREVRATADLALEHVTGPHTSTATSSNRYINGRSAYSAGTGDQAPEPVNNRRSAC